MELKAFVAETLTQIVEGVKDAQRQISQLDTNARVNPAQRFNTEEQHGDTSMVEFDVAVTVADESADSQSAGAEGSVGLLSVVGLKVSANVQGQVQERASTHNVSRVKFSVGLAQPSYISEKSMPAPIVGPDRESKIDMV